MTAWRYSPIRVGAPDKGALGISGVNFVNGIGTAKGVDTIQRAVGGRPWNSFETEDYPTETFPSTRTWKKHRHPPLLLQSPTNLRYPTQAYSYSRYPEDFPHESGYYPFVPPYGSLRGPSFVNTMEQYPMNDPPSPQSRGGGAHHGASPRLSHGAVHSSTSFDSMDHTFLQRPHEPSMRRQHGPSFSPFGGYATMSPRPSYPRGLAFYPHAYSHYPPPPPHSYLQPRSSRYPDHMASPEHAWSMGSPPPPSLQPPSLLVASDHASPSQVELIFDLDVNDVLSGRGGSTNAYRGNRAFREVVKGHQKIYLKAKKKDKPAVASLIVDTIRRNGGRFLKKLEKSAYPPHLYVSGPIWVDIGDEKAREKTSQALREGAPEIRKQTRRHRKGKRLARAGSGGSDSSDDEGDTNEDDSEDHGDHNQHVDPVDDTRDHGAFSERNPSGDEALTFSPRVKREEGPVDGEGAPFTPGGRTLSRQDEESDVKMPHRALRSKPAARSSGITDGRGAVIDAGMTSNDAELPILIRPFARLIPDRTTIAPMSVEQLSKEDRELYLNDFFPPHPQNELAYRTSSSGDAVANFDTCTPTLEGGSAPESNTGPCSTWPMLQV